MAENDDIETVKVVDEPITSKIKEDKPKADSVVDSKEQQAGVGGSAEGEGDKGFWEGIKEKLGTPENEGLKKAVNKVRIKLNRFGMLIAEAEQFVYEKYKLNQLMTPEEIHNEKAEIIEDTNIMIETRIKIMSAYGDIVNLVIDFMAHVVTRAFRYYQRRNGKIPDGSKEHPYPENDDEWSTLAKQTGFSVDELKEASGVK